MQSEVELVGSVCEESGDGGEGEVHAFSTVLLFPGPLLLAFNEQKRDYTQMGPLLKSLDRETSMIQFIPRPSGKQS
jgi:hypothetical protein